MTMNDSKQRPRTTVFPTVTNHSYEGDTLVLETLDPRPETNLVSTDDGLVRAGELVSDEQQEQLGLYQRN